MVKFAQQLQNELVPEWQDAYCSYADLKLDLQRIKQLRVVGPTLTPTGSLGLLKSLASFKHQDSGPRSRPRRDPNFISFSPRGQSEDTLVISKTRVGDDDVYASELREPLAHSPPDRTFFVRLDAQLTKVNKFYKKKEGEYIARAGVLERQMLALMTWRRIWLARACTPRVAPSQTTNLVVQISRTRPPMRCLSYRRAWRSPMCARCKRCLRSMKKTRVKWTPSSRITLIKWRRQI